MRIPEFICQNNRRMIVLIHTINACKMVFVDRLWLPFIDQTKSDIVVFPIIYFDI